MSVMVFGSLNLDLVAYAPELPALGQTVTGEKLLRFPGGKGLNQAIAAKRSGSEVKMVGCLGKDSEGEFLAQIIKEEKIESQFIRQVNKQTGVAVIEVNKEAENRILIIPGANAEVRFRLEQLDDSNPPKVCLAQLETPIGEVSSFFAAAHSKNIITILNPAPIQSLPKELLATCDYLVVNESEASFLIGKTVEKLNKDEAKIIANQLIDIGAKKVIITLGEIGSWYVDQEQEIFTNSFKINAVDTTAAGDAFCGGFATALAANKPIQYCLKFATAAGALAATKAGAVPSLPNEDQILSMLA